MMVGTVIFQIFLVLAVCGIAVWIAIDLDRSRFWRQYHKGKWVLGLLERGYLKHISRRR